MSLMAFWASTNGICDENDANTEAPFPSLIRVLSGPRGLWGVGGYNTLPPKLVI